MQPCPAYAAMYLLFGWTGLLVEYSLRMRLADAMHLQLKGHAEEAQYCHSEESTGRGCEEVKFLHTESDCPEVACFKSV